MNSSDEPNIEPRPDQWYNLTLGSSFNEQNPSKFCTLRYEFKPASIDKNQRGTLHKSKDNKVTVEFQNNQPGKPKVTFEGTSEDYKDTDAVLFFDGESFRLERLHRAVKRLRHNRTKGESSASSVKVTDSSPPMVGKGTKNHQASNRDAIHSVPVEVERIEVGDFKISDSKHRPEKSNEYHAANSSKPSPLGPQKIDDDQGQHLDTVNGEGTKLNIDINEPHQANMEEEEEIADIDVSDIFEENGQNAAEALRAQNAREKGNGTSSSSGSSSESSGSSSSSDSESSSGGDVSI